MYDYYTDSDINWKIFIVYSVLGMGLGIWVHDARTQRTRCARGELSNDWRQSENEIGKRSSQNSRTVPVIPFRIPIAPLPGQYPIGGNLRFLIFRAYWRGELSRDCPWECEMRESHLTLNASNNLLCKIPLLTQRTNNHLSSFEWDKGKTPPKKISTLSDDVLRHSFIQGLTQN